MINKLYTAKNGTPHVVRVLDVVREFTKGEKMENTAITQQVLLQRQKIEDYGEEVYFKDDSSFKKFSIELEPFLDEYQEIEPPKEVDADLFIRTNGTCEENKLCSSEELKTIKDALEEIQEANRQAEKPIQYQIGIDTFQRSKANQTAETRVEIAKFMIDKYNWRNKGQDVEDFQKIKDYCDFAIEALNEMEGKNV